jgi:hydrogenase maturation protease
VTHVRIAGLLLPHETEFVFPAEQSVEESPGGRVERVRREVELSVERYMVQLTPEVFRVVVRVCNLTAFAGSDREEVALRTLNAAHAVLQVRGGEFVSLTDPPPELRAIADDCRNEGIWPVLVGEAGRRDTLLASPIILPDYPQVAPESAGDFFDATEIDEMLTLRILTLTDAEKREMQSDPRARTVLQRVETLSDSAMGKLHGAVRSARGITPGDRVRLRPRGRADALDVLLAGKLATVAAVEADFEGTVYVAVVMDDDPGGDFGDAGQIAHRFFFRLEEVELLAEDAR